MLRWRQSARLGAIEVEGVCSTHAPGFTWKAGNGGTEVPPFPEFGPVAHCTAAILDGHVDDEGTGLVSSLDEAIEALDEFIAAVAAARVELRRTEKFLHGVRQLVVDGETVESLIKLRPPGRTRQAYTDALEELNKCRHAARHKVFALAVERGVSTSELGRAWGISRQLASRYVQADGAESQELATDPAEEDRSPAT
jgi:hypothetical protein